MTSSFKDCFSLERIFLGGVAGISQILFLSLGLPSIDFGGGVITQWVFNCRDFVLLSYGVPVVLINIFVFGLYSWVRRESVLMERMQELVLFFGCLGFMLKDGIRNFVFQLLLIISVVAFAVAYVLVANLAEGLLQGLVYFIYFWAIISMLTFLDISRLILFKWFDNAERILQDQE